MLEITPQLVGKSIAVPTRPDWGAGTVLSISSTQVDGKPQHRVTVHFTHGTRTLIVPPATLVEPQPEPQRDTGWLKGAGSSTLDDTLRKLPESVALHLGMLRDRLAVLLPYYAITDEPKSLMKWARDQTGVGDPLTQWSRDELTLAFGDFCVDRDSHLRNLAARLAQTEGREAVAAEIARLPTDIQTRIREALQRII